MTLRFSDGENFDTSGDTYRITRRSDGLYVIGRGFLCAVGSRQEGRELIAELTPEPAPEAEADAGPAD